MAENSINFMAMMNPAFAAQQQQYQVQQALAQKMMEDGGQQGDPYHLANPGGLVVPVSPLAAGAKALEKGLGGYMQGKALAAQMQSYQDLHDQQVRSGDMYGTATDAAIGKSVGPASAQDVANQYGPKLAAAMNGGATQGYTPNEISTLMMDPTGGMAKVQYEQRMKLQNAGPIKAAENAVTPVNQNGHMTYMTPPGSPQASVALPPALQQGIANQGASAPVAPPAGGSNAPAQPVNIVRDSKTIDFNNPAAVKGAETTATKGAESGTAYQDKINADAQDGIKGQRIIEQMKQNVQGFTPGKAASAKADLGAWAQSLGFDKDYIDQQLGNVGDVQSFNKLTAQLAVEAVKQMTSRGTQMEFKTFMQNNPNPDLNPDAMKTLLSFTGKSFDIPYQKQQEFKAWKKTNDISNYSDFDTTWNKKMKDNMGDSLVMHSPSATSQVAPDANDIAHLKENPQKAVMFDKAFGVGASQKYLTPSSQGWK